MHFGQAFSDSRGARSHCPSLRVCHSEQGSISVAVHVHYHRCLHPLSSPSQGCGAFYCCLLHALNDHEPILEELASSYQYILFLLVDVDDVKVLNLSNLNNIHYRTKI
ncbi:hypothetical protein HHK36_011117 [Tetracentron sinense]|uniref:Uncharacterized protein n=1 Tax=Tetracentron sinense TaxID=13715 RepID=A0A835DJL5_TETSI|nr:hypothetical protein HHK36_011117 [Tetracentron sinense]